MLITAIDTSAVASGALISDVAMEGVVDSFSTEDTRSHAEVLAPGIEKLPGWSRRYRRGYRCDRHGRGPRTLYRAAFGYCNRTHHGFRLEQTALWPDEP